jgi:predicted phosphate transport protein (TIGR00153 family)
MRLSLVPRTTEFYDLFARAGSNAVEVARLAETRFREFPDTEVTQERVKELEHEGDRLTHEIVTLLNTQYVTPFDRDDIFALAGAIDDIVDHIDEVSDLLDLYKIEGSMQQALEQCRILVEATTSLAAALAELKAVRGVQRHLTELKAREDEGDRILRDALAALFENEDVSPREIIRWKDIFDGLEDAIDACERAALVLGNIVVKAV